jgi:hypothetical protein
MADKWPLANGNWSNAANWNDGTLPAVGDDVFADGKTVTINQDVTVLSIRTTQRSGGTRGGSFTHNGGYTVTADVYVASNNTVAISNSSQIIGNIYGFDANSQGSGIICSGNAKITGNIIGTTAGLGNRFVDTTTIATGKLEFIGNVTTLLGQNIGIRNQSTTTGFQLEITGNISVGDNGGLSYGVQINNSSGSTINTITGNVIGSNTNDNSYGILLSSSFATLTVIGTSTGGNSGVGIIVSGAATVTLDKAVAGSLSTASIAGINCSSATAVVTVKELEYGANGQVPATGFIRFTNTINNKITITKEDDSQVTLIDINDASVYLPAESDVRDGVLYDPDLASEGTLIVPDPSNVRNGVPTDNTVGTADLTAQDFFNAIATSNDPVAIRLRNVATVETTGDQISAFNV